MVLVYVYGFLTILIGVVEFDQKLLFRENKTTSFFKILHFKNKHKKNSKILIKQNRQTNIPVTIYTLLTNIILNFLNKLLKRKN